MRPLHILALAVALNGCATKWTKPGATEADLDAAKASCTSRATERFPRRSEMVLTREAHFDPPQTQCLGVGADFHCTTTPGQFFPPTYDFVDANKRARDKDVRACLLEAGWTPDD